MNRVEVSGNLVKDVEVRTAGKGRVAKFTIAANTKVGDNEEVFFADCEAWNAEADKVEGLTKGTKCHVSGRIKTDKWKDKNTGENRYKDKIVAFKVTPNSFTGKDDSASSGVRNNQKSVEHEDIPF